MPRKSILRRTTKIDPMFFIPEGADELQYSERFSLEDPVAATGTPSSDYDPEDGPDYESESDNSNLPSVPDVLRVVSQTLRRSANGNVVVDVILEVEDIPGLANYDVRVTKT